MLTDPNILSYAVPALMPIAVSLQAGFMEECVFRAVPLALGALIGARFGRRGLGIGIAFVLQAVIFGAAHANYPGFPPYSRLVELVVPSMLWAAIFLRFGLLPTILLHALFDLALFSIPLFLVDAPGAWAQRAAVFAAGLVPLAVVLWRRAKAGAWGELPDALFNGGWKPSTAAPASEVPRPASWSPRAAQNVVQRALPCARRRGSCRVDRLDAACEPTCLRSPLDRARRRGRGRRGVEGARRDASAPNGAAFRRCVARAKSRSGRSTSSSGARPAPRPTVRSIGATLAPPLWEVRYAMFDGDVAARAEEWRITIDPERRRAADPARASRSAAGRAPVAGKRRSRSRTRSVATRFDRIPQR